jgi:hypothetical protein
MAAALGLSSKAWVTDFLQLSQTLERLGSLEQLLQWNPVQNSCSQTFLPTIFLANLLHTRLLFCKATMVCEEDWKIT